MSSDFSPPPAGVRIPPQSDDNGRPCPSHYASPPQSQPTQFPPPMLKRRALSYDDEARRQDDAPPSNTRSAADRRTVCASGLATIPSCEMDDTNNVEENNIRHDGGGGRRRTAGTPPSSRHPLISNNRDRANTCPHRPQRHSIGDEEFGRM